MSSNTAPLIIVEAPSMSRSLFSLNSISSPLARAAREDSMVIPRDCQFEKQTYQSIENFVPLLPDEIAVNIDDTLEISKIFNDGYAYGKNKSNGSEGVFPCSCLPLNSLNLLKPIQTRQSLAKTPIDKIGSDDLEIGVTSTNGHSKSWISMIIILTCTLAIITIIVTLSTT